MTKNNKRFKMITSIALALLLCLNMALPALAADYSEGTDAANPARAALTKILKMPVETPTPTANFIFTFDKVGMNEPTDNSTTALAGMPTIPNMTINYTGAAGDGTTIIDGDVKNVVKQTGNFLASITPAMWVNGEGVYKYTVTESTTSNIPIGDPDLEWATYSTASYDVEIWIDRDSTGTLFPRYVVVRIIPGSEDEYYIDNGTPANGKVDPTPDGGKTTPGTPPTIEEDFSQVIFTNNYWKTDGGGPTDPETSALEIIKSITGIGSDPTKYFTFSVKVTLSSAIPPTAIQTYKAYVMLGSNVVTSAANGTMSGTDATGGYFMFTSGTERTGINLTNDQRLVFVDLPIGSNVEVFETADTQYRPSYQRTFAGTGEFTAAVNTTFGFPRPGTGTGYDPGPHRTIAGASANKATFTNTRSGATPTGILVDNLPYIALLGLSLVSLVGLVAYKSRKRARNNV